MSRLEPPTSNSYSPAAGATEDSLIGLGRSLIVANQFVYTDETH